MYFDINVYYTMFPAYMPENLCLLGISSLLLSILAEALRAVSTFKSLRHTECAYYLASS